MTILKRIIGRINRFREQDILSFFAKSYFLSNLYYICFSSRFSREHYSVINGKLQHLRNAKKKNQSYSTLIRNIHRIEKGLIMRPRRGVFATNFIKETLDNFIGLAKKNEEWQQKQFKWFTDVLKEYFAVCEQHPIIDAQRARFQKFCEERSLAEDQIEKLIPYHRDPINKATITFEEFYKLNYYRRSVRWFLDKKVPHELIDKALLAALQAPSACNRQPFEYRIIDSPELLEQVRKLPMGIAGYEYNIPMMIVVIGNLDAYFDERDRHVIYIDASLANMSFMLGLETLGLSSCAINWPDIEHREESMQKLLNLSSYQRPIMCMAVGYPDPEGMVPRSEKKDLSIARKYN